MQSMLAGKRFAAQARTLPGLTRWWCRTETAGKFDEASQQAHVAIVDGENFTVMRNSGQMFEPKLEVRRKPDLTATNYSAGVKHQDDIGQEHGRTDLEELAHGAAAAEWLNAKAISGEIGDVLVVRTRRPWAKCGATITASSRKSWSAR